MTNFFTDWSCNFRERPVTGFCNWNEMFYLSQNSDFVRNLKKKWKIL